MKTSRVSIAPYEIDGGWKPMLLKGPHTDSLPGTHPGFRQRDGISGGTSGGTRDTKEEPELCGARDPVLSPPPV